MRRVEIDYTEWISAGFLGRGHCRLLALRPLLHLPMLGGLVILNLGPLVGLVHCSEPGLWRAFFVWPGFADMSLHLGSTPRRR